MKKNKIGKIVKYNLEKNLRNKWFVTLNLMFFIATVVLINFTTVKDILKNHNIISPDKELNIEVVDDTDVFYNELERRISENSKLSNVKLDRVNEVIYDENMPKENVIIEVRKSEENIINAKIISKDDISNKYESVIQDALDTTKEKLIFTKYEISKEQLEKIKEDVVVERIMVGVDSSNSNSKQLAQTIVSYITLLILMLILSKIASDISQEKVTKSIEYVLTSISAKEYLIAKILSISLTMIIQLVFSFIYFIIASSINSILNIFFGDSIDSINTVGMSLTNLVSYIDSTMLIYIIVVFVFLVFTVFFMCIVQATLTSRTTNISEAGNTTTILMTINLILYFISTLVISPVKETNIVIYILSCVPIFSMYFVPAMIIIGQANIFQIIISTVLLISSIPFTLNICSKIFKNGILDNVIKKKKENKASQEIDIKEKEISKVKKSELSRYGYVIGMSVIIYVAVQLVLTYVLSIFITPVSNLLNGKISTNIIEMIVSIITFALSLYIPAMFIKGYIDDEENQKEKIDKIDIAKIVCMAAPIMFVIQIGLGYLLEKLGLNYDIVDKIDVYKESSVMYNILFFIYISIMPAIFEELYVRKMVLKFSKKYGSIFAIISSAFLFALLHLNISQSLFAFLVGIVLAVIALKTGSIIPTAIIHFLNNGYSALYTIFESNNVALITINVIYGILIIIGLILLVMYVVKDRVKIKEVFNSIKQKSKEKKLSYKYIALDYTFIIAFILMIVMLILTQKTLELL